MTSDFPLEQAAKRLATSAGFDLCGVVALDSRPAELEYFEQWIAEGRAGEMHYLAARNDAGDLKRASLANAAPWARSAIVCALNYNADQPRSTDVRDRSRGWISRYAWFEQPDGRASDYHDAVLGRLRELERTLAAEFQQHEEEAASDAKLEGAPMRSWCYVDTGPIVERVLAKYAGIGWIAKNTCIINQKNGSWMFLGVVLTSIELCSQSTKDFSSDTPHNSARTSSPDSNAIASALAATAPDRCGSCTRCIDACPTGALIAPYEMDARRCIAYLTIEKRGEIPHEFREAIGNNVFGCDICQDVCPWNSANSRSQNNHGFASVATAPEFAARPELVAPPLGWLGLMSRDDFNATFRHSPIKRTKYEGFRRNVAIAIGNSGDPSLLPVAESIAVDPEPVVAEHGRWASGRLASASKGDG